MTLPDETLIVMGYVAGSVGIKGWINVKAGTEAPDGLLDYPVWYLGKDGKTEAYELEEGKLGSKGLQVKFKHTDDRNAADALRGMEVSIPRESFLPLDEDEFYWTDLIGLNVVNENGIQLGQVTGLMESGAHDILVLDGDYGQKLIPFIDEFVRDVSIDGITVNWESDY